MKNLFLGLDIGGTKCAVLLARVNRGIELMDKARFDTRAEKGFEYAYGLLCEAIEAVVARNRLSLADIEAIGVSCGGPLDSARGVVLCPPNLPGWVNIPLKEMLEERYGVKTFLQNDANACALVEWKLGAGRGCKDMIFLTMGTGMGGGIIADGRLISGCCDMGGEVGHLRLTQDGPEGFGKAGSLEGYTSGGGIARQAEAYTRRLTVMGAPPAWSADEGSIDAKLMARYAREGDKDAIAFFDGVGAMLGKGLALLVDTLNPERIVIGSVFARCEELLRPSMERELKREAIPFSLERLSVLPAATGERLGDYAGVMAALYALGIDPMDETDERDERVLALYRRLLKRYPALETCREQVMRAYLMLRDCYRGGGKALLMGNGGSCADCEHIVGELMKGFLLKRPLTEETKRAIRGNTEAILPGAAELLQQGLPAIALSSHTALSTAVGNDLDAALTAAQQVVGYGRAGDVFIGVSTSGNARNVLLAAGVAKALGMKTLGLSGQAGGRMLGQFDCVIAVPAVDTADVQELHLPVYHALCAMLEAKFFAKDGAPCHP